ncbi:F0F1 ATP synthase subunit delta [Deferrisoma palaeochoriense]
MNRKRIARRYAKALFELARDAGRAEEVGRELREIYELLSTNPELRATLLTPVLPRRVKAEVLAALLERLGPSDLVANFLRVLLEARKLPVLSDILEAYEALADEAAGRVRGEVLTALPLEPDEVEAIRTALAKRLEKEVQLSARQDPEILGGVVARVGNLVFDASLRTQLQRLRDSFLKG